MTEKKFLQETNFADEIEEIQPEEWNPEASSRAHREFRERQWTEASLKDSSY